MGNIERAVHQNFDIKMFLPLCIIVYSQVIINSIIVPQSFLWPSGWDSWFSVGLVLFGVFVCSLYDCAASWRTVLVYDAFAIEIPLLYFSYREGNFLSWSGFYLVKISKVGTIWRKIRLHTTILFQIFCNTILDIKVIG